MRRRFEWASGFCVGFRKRVLVCGSEIFLRAVITSRSFCLSVRRLTCNERRDRHGAMPGPRPTCSAATSSGRVNEPPPLVFLHSPSSHAPPLATHQQKMTVDRPTLPAVPEYPTTEPHKQELDAAQALFEKELSSLEGWDDQGERDGVQLHTKPDPDVSCTSTPWCICLRSSDVQLTHLPHISRPLSPPPLLSSTRPGSQRRPNSPRGMSSPKLYLRRFSRGDPTPRHAKTLGSALRRRLDVKTIQSIVLRVLHDHVGIWLVGLS